MSRCPHCEVENMDPSLFLQYSPPSGLPQESKLATYMKHSNSCPPLPMNLAVGEPVMEPSTSRRDVISDYVPINYYAPANMLQETQQSPQGIPANTQVHQENVGGTTYFYSTNSDNINTPMPLNQASAMGLPDAHLAGAASAIGPPMIPSPYATQMYASTHTHMGPINQKPPGLASTYTPEVIRSEMCQRNDEINLHPDLSQFTDLPEHVEMYTNLTPLEELASHHMATSFRVTHRESGDLFILRRLRGYSSVPNKKKLDMWMQIDHPNIARLHRYFITMEFGDHSMILVYDYHPSAVTMMSKYLTNCGGNSSSEHNGPYTDPFSSDPNAPRPYTHQKNTLLRAVASGVLLPESVLWSFLVQLTSALRVIHSMGLAYRNLDLTKVIVAGCRLHIIWCGVEDILRPISEQDDVHAIQEDLAALGRLTLTLACRSLHCCENLQASLEVVSKTYSLDFKNLILYLLATNPSPNRSVTDLMPMIGGRFYTQVEALERRTDILEYQFAREIHNSRMFGTIVKMNSINERPELNMDPSWSETGNRYLLKLFRDHVFHAVTMDGRPWLDHSHIVHCLNQLDSGNNTRVVLMSRNQESVLVVTYAELKHCLEQAFEEVMQAAAAPP